MSPLENQKKEFDRRLRIRYGISDIAKIKTKKIIVMQKSEIGPQINIHLTDSNSIHPGLEQLPYGLTVSGLTTTSVSLYHHDPLNGS